MRPTPRALLALALLVTAAAAQDPGAPAPAPEQPAATQPVCGADGETWPSAAAAQAAGARVLHCQPCGACSNPQDLGVYAATASSLTLQVRACGLRTGEGATAACLAALGFTPGCAACFKQNVECDAQQCLAPCLDYALSSGGGGGGGGATPPAGQESLAGNACLACDEDKCGPAFKACAGANRRRAGIVSDIARDAAELCGEVAAGAAPAPAEAAAAPAPAPAPDLP